ncbi:MAG: TIGR00270 family protein [Methanosphaera sp. rholeuAM6]|nr:MAG: TIGR00270 family protein [Methanosphaera sp. rholeuAM6]
MNCEICGSEIKGEPYKTKIDNSVMVTCKECSRYGKVQSKPQPPKKRAPKGKPNNNFNSRPAKKNQTYTRKPRDEEYELVEDYAKIIRQKREIKGLTQKQLGEKLYERESVIHKIENGKMVPDEKIARKIEKLLNIEIIEKTDSDEREFQDARQFREATIGDIARIKRK